MDKQIIIYHGEVEEVSVRRGSDDESETGSKKVKGREKNTVLLSKLKSNIDEFYEDISSIFANLRDKEKGFVLEEIVVNAEIGIDGKLGFMGTGIGGSAKAGISFKLKKNTK